MIKLKYNLLEFFNHLEDDETFILECALNGFKKMTITDLLESGYTANLVERKKNISVLSASAKWMIKIFYNSGKFQTSPFLKNRSGASFTDEKLQGYIRNDPISENDIKNILFDLLTKAHLNLDMICPAMAGMELWNGPAELRQLVMDMGSLDNSTQSQFRQSTILDIQLDEGPALSQLRQLATSPFLPQSNAFSQALAEYDQL